MNPNRSAGLALAFAALIILAAFVGRSSIPTQAITNLDFTSLVLETRKVFWNPANPKDVSAGSLTFVGGLELSSPHPDFGGLSGLLVTGDGKSLLAVSDQGKWITLDPIYENNAPVGIELGLLASMLDNNGTPLSGKSNTDAEGLTKGPDGSLAEGLVVVSFERNHRISSFDFIPSFVDARAQRVEDFGVFDNLENNGGLEAITYLPDGSLLAISEKTFDEDGYIVGAQLTAEGATPVRLKQHPPYALTDIDVLPNGDIITLERHYSALAGVSMMMRRIPADMLESNEPLDGEVLVEANHTRSIDNMEGLSVRQDSDGRTLFYVISDDNFNPIQRTLLLVFTIDT